MGPWYCQVYQLREQVWRWEVLHWNNQASRFNLKNVGTQPTLAQGIAAAEDCVEIGRKTTPS
jgi:hypothetical protein